jgi:hypothetical protein
MGFVGNTVAVVDKPPRSVLTKPLDLKKSIH